ncbi:anthocyanin 3'-O-beta-glucosyltransferase [Trifolium pratense]|uniref:Anthocyanin 3'-O-beta-glucosyltransferase n=1 Tax=Trifolium pratense TaxID=57577 RepID=A0A2K3K6Q3_TRIPR|nr:anthocyanin 3'-O-beta-glucosyltransferase [Trifolium pratense]
MRYKRIDRFGNHRFPSSAMPGPSKSLLLPGVSVRNYRTRAISVRNYRIIAILVRNYRIRAISVCDYRTNKHASANEEVIDPTFARLVFLGYTFLQQWAYHMISQRKEINTELMKVIKESERKSFGSVFNSFYELESDYYDHYKKVMGSKSCGLIKMIQIKMQEDMQRKSNRVKKKKNDG